MSTVDLIEDVAHTWPDAVALSAGSRKITYGALINDADELARELIALGAGVDIPIGICVDRSIEHVIAMLGALRAGSCFLPLDPDWPDDRLFSVLDDAGAPIVVAAPRLVTKLRGSNRNVLSSAREACRRGALEELPAR